MRQWCGPQRAGRLLASAWGRVVAKVRGARAVEALLAHSDQVVWVLLLQVGAHLLNPGLHATEGTPTQVQYIVPTEAHNGS